MATIAEQLDAARREWSGAGEAVIDTGLTYDGEEPVRVFVRKRGHRYDVHDAGRGVAKAAVERWREVAERTVEDYWLNVNRRGVVFVGAVEGGPVDVGWLVGRVAEASRAVYGAVLDSHA